MYPIHRNLILVPQLLLTFKHPLFSGVSRLLYDNIIRLICIYSVPDIVVRSLSLARLPVLSLASLPGNRYLARLPIKVTWSGCTTLYSGRHYVVSSLLSFPNALSQLHFHPRVLNCRSDRWLCNEKQRSLQVTTARIQGYEVCLPLFLALYLPYCVI